MEVRTSRLRVALALWAAVLMAALSFWAMREADSFWRIAGMILALVSGLTIFILLYELIRPKSYLRIDHEGISTNYGRIGTFFLPWSMIRAVRRSESRTTPMLAVDLVDLEGYLSGQPRPVQMAFRANVKLMESPLAFAPGFFPITLDEMEAAVERYRP